MVNLLETHFPTVAYFSCSALGTNADSAGTTGFHPVRVVAPLLWLLYHGRALGNAGIDYVADWGLEIMWRSLGARLKGDDGPGKAALAWLGAGLALLPLAWFAYFVWLLMS